MFSIKNRTLVIIINYFKRFNLLVTKVVNTLLLSVVYFVGIGITSVVGKSFRKRFLDMELKEKETYWAEIEDRKKTRKDYKRMF